MTRVFCFAVCLGLLSSTGWAQLGGNLDELYGEGVHRYFANDLSGADQILSQVVDGGSQDPRAHYFRGLARERQGYGGEMDFESGARLEQEGKRSVDVGVALSRIQGSIRTKIETARRDARVQAAQQKLMLQQSQELMNSAAGSAAPAAPTNSSPLPENSVRANESSLVPPPRTAPEPATQPAAPTADTDNPFGDDPAVVPADAAPDAPAADDPFGAPSTDAPAAADPFGAPSADEPAADFADPFAT